MHWSELKRPPRPAELVVSGGDPGGIGVPGGTSLQVSQVASSSEARNAPSLKSASSVALRCGNGPPAPGAPPRGPGSWTLENGAAGPPRLPSSAACAGHGTRHTPATTAPTASEDHGDGEPAPPAGPIDCCMGCSSRSNASTDAPAESRSNRHAPSAGAGFPGRAGSSGASGLPG